MPALVEVVTEADADRGWHFVLRSLDADGACTSHAMNLSWADYDWWSPEGIHEPSRVALAVAEVMHHALAGECLPQRFDAATVRRRVHDADALIRSRLGSGGGP